jgi:hypothetical protein
MIVEAQKIFTDTTMQDQPIDFRVLAGSFHQRVKFRHVAESENFWYLMQSSSVEVDVGSDVVETKHWSPGKVVLCFANMSPAGSIQTLSNPGPETEEGAFPTLFSASYHRKVLFSKELEIQPGKLRRWKPQTTFDPALLSEEENG